MPELPEVETVMKTLRDGGRNSPSILDEEINSVDIFWQRSLALPDVKVFLATIPNRKITAVSRRGKYIVIQLENDYLLFHLRMSGDLFVVSNTHQPSDLPSQKHDRIVFHLSHDLSLHFNDPRKFGRVWYTPNPEKILDKLGPEPFDPAFTAPHFYSLLKTRNRFIKTLLMDQTFLAGVGNIYSDEALFMAGIHPQQKSNTISQTKAEKLFYSIQDVLLEGIKNNGSSIDWVYRGGNHQNFFRVYQQTGKPCRICGNNIQHITVGQRSTHFCPLCQQISV